MSCWRCKQTIEKIDNVNDAELKLSVTVTEDGLSETCMRNWALHLTTFHRLIISM